MKYKFLLSFGLLLFINFGIHFNSQQCPINPNFIILDWSAGNPFGAFPTTTISCTGGLQTIWKMPESTSRNIGDKDAFPGFQMNIPSGLSPTASSILVSVNGVPYSYYGPIANAPPGVLNWGPLSTTFDVIEPFIKGGSSIKIEICDTRGGTQNIPYTIYDHATGTNLTSGTAMPSNGNCYIIPLFTISSPAMVWNIDDDATKITNNNDGSGTFDPSQLSIGSHTIKYSFNNNGCTLTANQTITITCATLPTPTCGTIDFNWQTGSAPSSISLNCTNNTDYGFKADLSSVAGNYIAPGFTINNGVGVNLSKIEVQQGIGSSFINTFLQNTISYCVPSFQYSVKLTGTGSGNITFTDHATEKIIYTGAFISGSIIVLPPYTILGSATFSGPGVSNYKKSNPTEIASGYGVFNPAIAGPGTHTITYTWDNGMGCNGTITKAVTVTGISIKPTFNTMSTQCPNSVAQILQPTSNNSIIGTWNPLTVNTSTLGKTTYTFTPNAGQCATTETIDITIKPIVKPTFNLTNNYCFNYPAQALPTTSDNSIIGIWNPASINTNISGSSIYHFTPNTDQCGSKVSETITVFEKPIANVTPSTISGKAILEIYFTNLSTNATKLNWDYGNGETSTTIGNTSSSYTNVGNYNVTLIASNGICPDSIWKTIITVLPIDPLTFNIPNIFTPNNDGVNDHYFIELENAASFEAKIFNRWGNEMISQNKINEKWDGKSASGKMSDDGVYFIKYKIIGLDKSVKEGVASFQLQN